jgi:hypothetical protein
VQPRQPENGCHRLDLSGSERSDVRHTGHLSPMRAHAARALVATEHRPHSAHWQIWRGLRLTLGDACHRTLTDWRGQGTLTR